MPRFHHLRELEVALGFSLSRYYVKGRPTDHAGLTLGGVGCALAAAVAKGDVLAIQDACALISLDPHLPFGKLTKSRLARALKKNTRHIQAADRERLVKSTSALLSLEYCPRETEDYCKLIRKLGKKESNAVLASATPRDPKSVALVSYLEDHGT